MAHQISALSDIDSRSRGYIADLATVHRPGLFNPWLECSPDEPLPATAPASRRERLRHHLLCPDPAVILIGEAPGYQGARYSGLAFTSERLLLNGAIPRVPSLLGERISTRPRPWSEPSAAIVWKGLYEVGLAHRALLWNSVPWHPMLGNQPHTNRTPTEEERVLGLEYLQRFLELFPGVMVAAVGKVAERSIQELGVDALLLRHPANGGATLFRDGLKELARQVSH